MQYAVQPIAIFKERKMTIYQIINEQNNPVEEFVNLHNATIEAEKLNLWEEDHYFYVAEIELDDH
jgi:hypothetical protein